MNNKKLGILASTLILCIGAVACANYSTPTEITPTVAPASTDTPMPTTTAAPIQGLPISEENFGDANFCAYLKEKFDSDRNGYFSDEELAAVKRIWVGMRNLGKPYSEMKGFSYFPELEYLELNSADKVEICDVPKLSSVELVGKTSVQTYRMGDLTIKNCPALETVRIQDMTATVGQGKEVAEFVVENCPKLRTMTLLGDGMNSFEKVSLKISGALELSLHTHSCRPDKIVLDTSVFQSEELPVVDVKNKKVDTSGLDYIIWNGETATEYEAALTELEAMVLKLQEGFFVEVQEVTPALYDEDGKKAYQVLVNNKYLAGKYYGIGPGYYRNYENETFVMYSDEPLTEEDFSFQWQELLTMPIAEYSPLRGFHGQLCGTITGDEDEEIRQGFAGDLICRNGEENESFWEVKVWISYSVSPEDGLRYAQDGVWFTETPELVIPEADELPIAREYFSNLVFRDYLEENVDLDHNGYLSVAEREGVTEIYAHDYDMGPNVVDGLDYFPNLKKLCIGECQKLVCQNCPELRLIAVFGEGTAEVVTENCPKLEVIDTKMDVDVYSDNYSDWE